VAGSRYNRRIRRHAACEMSRPTRIEGLAIISADGMLADADGHMPKSLLVESDQQFFQDTLDQAAVLVQGRHSHEGSPRAAHRRRLVLTRRIASIAADTTYPHALLWNPQGATLQQAWERLAAPDGMLAVIGGTEVYALFLTIGFDRFHLSRAPHVRLPGGRPVFPEVGPGRTPEQVLASHGLKPGPQHVFDAALGVTMVTWSR
jgi:dihydrofolate reductase